MSERPAKYPTTPEMLKPSPALIRLLAFRDEYRRNKPTASMNEIQHAFQLAENKRLFPKKAKGL